MKAFKPVILKTYGRERRKLSAWISPENRKQAFNSSRSTDSEISVFEPANPVTRTKKSSVASHRAGRPAKRKAMQCLTEKTSDEDDIISDSTHPQPTKKSKTARGKKITVCRGRAERPAKRKAMSCLTDNSSDEEIVDKPPPPPRPQPDQQSKTTRKKKSLSGRAGKGKATFLAENSEDGENIRMPRYSSPQSTLQSKATRKSKLVSVPGVSVKGKSQISSGSEEDSVSSTRSHKKSFKMKRASHVHPPSAGRFVTRRRCAGATKSKLTKAMVHVFNSSDDFTPGGRGRAIGSSRILRPSRSRRDHSVFMGSSVENLANAAGTGGFATNPFREISLNESADHSLGRCPRKPIFCSTPSASTFSKRPRVKPSSINDQSSNPSSMSVSLIGLVSTFQEDLDSTKQTRSASPVVPHSEEKQQSSLGELQKQAGLRYREENSGDVFMELKSGNKTNSCEDLALSSLNLLTTYSEGSSHFVSAAGGLEWLIEALKERCLTNHCSVQLERLNNLSVTQLSSQTAYSSCLGYSDSSHSQQTNLLSIDIGQTTDLLSTSERPFYPSLCETKDESVYDHESCEQAALETASEISHLSLSVDLKPSAENESTQQSTSLLCVGSINPADSSVDFIMGTELPANGPVHTSTREEPLGVQNKYVKKCTVPVNRLTLSQPKRFRKSFLACDQNTVQSTNNSAIAQTQTDAPETEEKAGTLIDMLKERCLTDKCNVGIKRLSLSQLKAILQHTDLKLKSPTDVSDGASDDRTNSDHQSESDTDRSKEISPTKVSLKKRRSTTCDNNICTDKEEVVQNSCDILPKRKKTSLPKEKKRRSTSTDRPGTTRKACISGLSVSRWKNKSSASTHVFKRGTAQKGGMKAMDSSINELISSKPKQQSELFGATMTFSTPVRASRLNLSSLLADLTPNTQTWSRLKAALSVHRKVLLTPRTLRLSEHGSSRMADVSQDLFASSLRTPLPKHLKSQLQSCESLVMGEEGDLSDAEKVYSECGQQRPLPWEECILPQRMKQCVKIGEGTFGEVFSTTNASGETVALKVIPVEGSEKVNGEDQKTYGEILHEIIISKELSSLKEKQQNQTHSFIGLNDLHCVRGSYPADFLKAWDTFDKRKGSENDRPDFFEKDQTFLILEFEFGGVDLENSNGTLSSLGVAKSILHQVTAALAVAEQELCFEHRDLHWGNVLVKTTTQKKGSFHLNGTAHTVETKGVLVRVIDYSLSRLEIDDLTVSCDISNDEELFIGQGDYQFDIYRLMRQENGNNWSNYHPHTNVLWLHYLCSKLLSMKYRGSGGRGVKDTREELTRFYDNILQYNSATEALRKCPMFQ